MHLRWILGLYRHFSVAKKFITRVWNVLSTPFRCPKFRLDAIFETTLFPKDHFWSEDFRKLKTLKNLCDVFHRIFNLAKIITRSIFIVSGWYFNTRSQMLQATTLFWSSSPNGAPKVFEFGLFREKKQWNRKRNFELNSRFTRKFITWSSFVRKIPSFYTTSSTQRSTTFLWSPSPDSAPINTRFCAKTCLCLAQTQNTVLFVFMLTAEYSKGHISFVICPIWLQFLHEVDIDVGYVFVFRPESKFRTETPANLHWTCQTLMN